MSQYGRPDSDITNYGWSYSTGSTLYTLIDETTPDDGDYIYSPAPVNTYCVVGLSDVTDPGSSSGHYVRYRWRTQSIGGGTGNFTVRLLEGSTEIASWAHTGVGGQSNITTERELSSSEANSITDYTDLRIRFEGNKTGGTIWTIYVGWAEFEAPDTSGGVSSSKSAYMKGSASTSDNQIAYLGGGTSISSSKSSFLNGAEGTTSSKTAYLEGISTPASNISCYMTGPSSQSDISIIGNRGYILGVGSTYPRAIGFVTPTANLELLVQYEVFFDNVSGTTSYLSFFLRSSGLWQDNTKPTKGYALDLVNQDGGSPYISLHRINPSKVQIGSTTINWNTSGKHSLRFRCQGYQISAKIWNYGESEPSEWTLSVDDTTSGFQDAGSFQLSMTPSTLHATTFYLDDLSVDSPTGEYDAYSYSDAFTQGSLSAQDTTPCYLYGMNGLSDSQNAYLKGLDSDNSAQSAFTRGRDSSTTSTGSFTNGVLGSSSSQIAFLDGGSDTAITSSNAFLKGGIVSVDNQIAYLSGLSSAINIKHGFLKGSSGSQSNKSAFLSGSLGSNSSTKAFLSGRASTSSSKPAYLIAGTQTSSSKKAYTSGIGIVQSSQKAYISGFISRIHAFLEGAGQTRNYIWLRDSLGFEKQFKVVNTNIDNKNLDKAVRLQYTTEGVVDVSVSEERKTWTLTLRMKREDTTWGDLEDLEHFYSLNDPQGSPTNVLVFTDNNQNNYNVYLIQPNTKQYMTYTTQSGNALVFVQILLVEK